MEDDKCPLCGGDKEILDRKTRMLGYTLTDGETIDEQLVPCPLCQEQALLGCKGE